MCNRIVFTVGLLAEPGVRHDSLLSVAVLFLLGGNSVLSCCNATYFFATFGLASYIAPLPLHLFSFIPQSRCV